MEALYGPDWEQRAALEKRDADLDMWQREMDNGQLYGLHLVETYTLGVVNDLIERGDLTPAKRV